MLDAGIRVTINSDDPAYFGGYVNANYLAVAEALDLDAAQIATLAANSFAGSFLEEAEKHAAITEIEAIVRPA
jgi:adenosine deaminase